MANPLAIVLLCIGSAMLFFVAINDMQHAIYFLLLNIFVMLAAIHNKIN